MSVVFNGKRMERCPIGDTICKQLSKITGMPSSICMTTVECDIKMKEGLKEDIPEEDVNAKNSQQQLEEENKEEKEKENIENINDFLSMLDRGVIVDIETGRNLGMIDMSNLDQVVDFFKSMSRLFSNETIGKSALGEDLLSFLNILTSKSIENKPEVAAGLTEKFLQNKMGIS